MKYFFSGVAQKSKGHKLKVYIYKIFGTLQRFFVDFPQSLMIKLNADQSFVVQSSLLAFSDFFLKEIFKVKLVGRVMQYLNGSLIQDGGQTDFLLHCKFRAVMQ
jgi:hypothetical protein